MPFFPLGSAFDFLPKVTDRAAVRAAAVAMDVTPAQIGLAWLLAHAPNVLLIPGTADPAHLADNMAVGSITLDADTLAALEADTRAPTAPNARLTKCCADRVSRP